MFDGWVQIYIWDTASSAASAPVSTIEPFEGQALGSVTWLQRADGGAPWILAGDAVNRELRLFHGDVASGFHLRQALRLESLEGEQAFYNHLVYHAASSLIVLANSRRSAVYAVHLGPGKESSLRFDYLAKFGVGVPMLSLTAAPPPDNGQDAVQLFCVQKQGISQCSLHPQMCRAPADKARAAAEPNYSAASANAGISGPAQHPLSSEADTSAMGSQAEQVVESRQLSSTNDTPSPPTSFAAPDATVAGSLPAGETSSPAAAASASLPLPLPPPVTTPPAAAVPQPRLLTPKQLIKLTGSRTASQGSSTSTDLHTLRTGDSPGPVPPPPPSAGLRSPSTPFTAYSTAPAAASPPPETAVSKALSPGGGSPAPRSPAAPAADGQGDAATSGTPKGGLNGVHVGPAKILKRRKEGERPEVCLDVLCILLSLNAANAQHGLSMSLHTPL